MKTQKLLIILIFFSLLTEAQTIDYKYQMMFINNFAKNIEWPGESQSGDFTIGIFDNSKIADEMEAFFNAKNINGRKVVIKKFNSIESIASCHILFVPISNKNNITQILAKAGNNPTLIITEKEGWGKKGSVINFVISEDGRMKFELNKEAAQKRLLKVPGTLANLAIII